MQLPQVKRTPRKPETGVPTNNKMQNDNTAIASIVACAGKSTRSKHQKWYKDKSKPKKSHAMETSMDTTSEDDRKDPQALVISMSTILNVRSDTSANIYAWNCDTAATDHMVASP